MSSEVKFWTVVCVFVLVLAGFPVGCTVHQNEKIAEAIKAGADPIAAGCAYRSTGNEPLCMQAGEQEAQP